MEKLSCFCATNIIAVSYGVKKTVNHDITNKKVDIIYKGSANGMMIEEFLSVRYDNEKIKQELSIAPDDFVFGFLGRIVGDKGINELVQAFMVIDKHHDHVKLLLVGAYEDDLDPLQQETKEMIKNNPNIIEVGFQSDIKKFLSVMDIMVSPSYREGFGMTILEANLMGKPVIATKITGYSEIITEARNGFFVAPKNVESLLSVMKSVLSRKDHLLSLSPDCVRMVKEKYDHKDVLQAAIGYYGKWK